MRQVFQFASRSSNDTHIVTVENKTITCTCRGFRSPSKCWHVRDIAEKLRLPNTSRSTTHSEPVIPPGFINPMLASALPEGKTIADYQTVGWLLEPKYDGHRLIVRVTKEHVTAWSRASNLRDLPPHLHTALRQLAHGTYDGELYVPDHTSTDVARTDVTGKLRLALFDMLRVDNRSCLHLTARDRRLLLDEATSRVDTDLVVAAPQFPVSARALHKIWDAGGEGAIIKRTDAKYIPGRRTADWIKFKQELSTVIVVTKFEAGEHGPYSVIVGIDNHGKDVRVKSRNHAWRADCAKRPHHYIGRQLVVTYQQKTKNGNHRSPIADHWL